MKVHKVVSNDEKTAVQLKPVFGSDVTKISLAMSNGVLKSRNLNLSYDGAEGIQMSAFLYTTAPMVPSTRPSFPIEPVALYTVHVTVKLYFFDASFIRT
jgi:hypothetical protein